jgi:retron-type reverse transcriptase
VSRNGTADCFVLKCDIRKFFDSVDHVILLNLLGERIKDEDTMWLLRCIIESYQTTATLSLSLSRERERERERRPAAA